MGLSYGAETLMQVAPPERQICNYYKWAIAIIKITSIVAPLAMFISYCVTDEVLSFCALNKPCHWFNFRGEGNEQKLLKIDIVYIQVINQCFLHFIQPACEARGSEGPAR